MKFALCHELFENWDWPRQCQLMAEIGYTGIELAPFTVAPLVTVIPQATRQLYKQQAADHGLVICGMHWLLAKTTGFHVTSRDPAVRKATGEYLFQIAQACADFGGNILVFGSPAQRNLPPDMSLEEGRDLAADTFRHMLPALAERQVRLCLEPLTTKETNFLTSCEETMQLVRQLDHPQVCLHQDVKAMLPEAKPIPELIHEFAPYVGHFHVNDSNLLGPGMGETDYHPIIQALLDTHYSGWVSVEVFDYTPGAEYIARRSYEYLQQMLADLGAN